MGELLTVEGNALDTLNRGEIDIQISTAHRYPRNVEQSRQRARQMILSDKDTAESCVYRLERAGKAIEGPSIRIAELIAAVWGNLRFGARIISQDAKFVTAQGVCHDLESNIATTVEVLRRITDRSGRTYSDDMIAVTANAAASIAMRNAILRVIPRTFVDQLCEEAKKATTASIADAKALTQRWIKAAEWFGKRKVSVEQLLTRLGRATVAGITAEDMVQLNGIKTAINDGEITVEEAFATEGETVEETGQDASETLAAKVEGGQEKST